MGGRPDRVGWGGRPDSKAPGVTRRSLTAWSQRSGHSTISAARPPVAHRFGESAASSGLPSPRLELPLRAGSLLCRAGDACRKNGTLLLVDTVCSLGGVPLYADEWKVGAPPVLPPAAGCLLRPGSPARTELQHQSASFLTRRAFWSGACQLRRPRLLGPPHAAPGSPPAAPLPCPGPAGGRHLLGLPEVPVRAARRGAADVWRARLGQAEEPQDQGGAAAPSVLQDIRITLGIRTTHGSSV